MTMLSRQACRGIGFGCVLAVVLAGCSSVQQTERSWNRDPDRRVHSGYSEGQLGYTGFGAHWVEPDGDADGRIDGGPAVSVTIGYLLTQKPVALAAEAGGYFSWHDAEGPLRQGTEDFFMSRALLGGRAMLTALSQKVVPYVRGGWMYRYDDGDGSFEDGGTGYYYGAGLDITLTPGLSVAPQVLFTRSDVFNLDETDELFYGLEFHLNY